MAVSTSCQDILTAAASRSFFNRQDTLAAGTELLKVLDRLQRAAFTVAARINPAFFAASQVKGYTNGGWDRPDEAESVLILMQGATEVVPVPFDQQDAETGMPTVYALGHQYRPVDASINPVPASTAPMTMIYSRRPTSLVQLAQLLDQNWPEQFNDILILGIAMYLAQKDNRGDEKQALEAELDSWLALYSAFLQHETVGLRYATRIPRLQGDPALKFAKDLFGQAAT